MFAKIPKYAPIGTSTIKLKHKTHKLKLRQYIDHSAVHTALRTVYNVHALYNHKNNIEETYTNAAKKEINDEGSVETMTVKCNILILVERRNTAIEEYNRFYGFCSLISSFVNYFRSQMCQRGDFLCASDFLNVPFEFIDDWQKNHSKYIYRKVVVWNYALFSCKNFGFRIAHTERLWYIPIFDALSTWIVSLSWHPFAHFERQRKKNPNFIFMSALNVTRASRLLVVRTRLHRLGRCMPHWMLFYLSM